MTYISIKWFEIFQWRIEGEKLFLDDFASGPESEANR